LRQKIADAPGWMQPALRQITEPVNEILKELTLLEIKINKGPE
jgi:hypothetical protein